MASEPQVSGQKTTKPPAQILIIRHGEKPGNPGVDNKDDGPDLSTKGYERAAALAFELPAAFGEIDYLFAAPQVNEQRSPRGDDDPARRGAESQDQLRLWE